MRTLFRVSVDARGKWYGVDPRYELNHLAMRHGPSFDTQGQARAWCEVRGVCVLETGGQKCRYVGVLPF